MQFEYGPQGSVLLETKRFILWAVERRRTCRRRRFARTNRRAAPRLSAVLCKVPGQQGRTLGTRPRDGDPYGTRTRVFAVRGRRPRPLDEGATARRSGRGAPHMGARGLLSRRRRAGAGGRRSRRT